MVLLLERNVCCWGTGASSWSLSSELSCSTGGCFEWLYLRLCELDSSCCFIAFFESVAVAPFPFCVWPWPVCCLLNFSTWPVDIRGAIDIGPWLRFCFVEGILMFLTDSRMICRIVFRNALRNSVVLQAEIRDDVRPPYSFNHLFNDKKMSLKNKWTVSIQKI